ncbi:uncharacterized protein [Heterodontus francisci]|uniref:uncharacterized protein n=1 Tax=Heterodontus francisci TaxID=7792 RepID=UPI00355B3001
MIEPPTNGSECILSIRLSPHLVQYSYSASLLQHSAPQLKLKTSSTKNSINIISSIPNIEHLFLLGDFNARVGADHDSWPSCLGRYGIGQMNENRQRLLELCTYHNLCITNSFFQTKPITRFHGDTQDHIVGTSWPSSSQSSEAWTTYVSQERCLNTFHLRCLRRILGIRWQDRISNAEVLEVATIPSIYAPLSQRRLRWLGHVSRMEDGRIPKDALYSELVTGIRPTGCPCPRFKDVCKCDIKSCNIDHKSLESVASDCQICNACVRVCHSRIGLQALLHKPLTTYRHLPIVSLRQGCQRRLWTIMWTMTTSTRSSPTVIIRQGKTLPKQPSRIEDCDSSDNPS